MNVSNLGCHALTFGAAFAVLTACNSGGSQVAPFDSMPQHAAQFNKAKISHDGIVYTPADVSIENSQYNLDLNNDSTTDFVIAESNTSTKPNCQARGMNRFATLSLSDQGSNSFEANGNYVARLIRGSRIGPSQNFTTGSEVMESSSIMWHYVGQLCESFGGNEGNWPPQRRRRYIGLAFVINGETHYGWAAITVSGGYGSLSARLRGYAYQTRPGKSIKAGQI